MAGKSFKCKIPTFDWTAKSKWHEWQDFKLGINSAFVTPTYKDVEAKDKVLLIINWMGIEAQKKVDSWPEAEKTAAMETTNAFYVQMEKGWKNASNAQFSRLQFSRIQRQKNQTGDEFMAELRFKAKDCGFTNDEERIRDQFIYGIADEEMCKELCKLKENSTPEELLVATRQIEAANANSSAMKDNHVDAVQAPNSNKRGGRGGRGRRG